MQIKCGCNLQLFSFFKDLPARLLVCSLVVAIESKQFINVDMPSRSASYDLLVHRTPLPDFLRGRPVRKILTQQNDLAACVNLVQAMPGKASTECLCACLDSHVRVWIVCSTTIHSITFFKCTFADMPHIFTVPKCHKSQVQDYEDGFWYQSVGSFQLCAP